MTVRRPSLLAASVGATVALAAASAGTVVMWPAGNTPQSARSVSARAGSETAALPESATGALPFRQGAGAVSEARAAQAEAGMQAAQVAIQAAQRAAAQRAAVLAAQRQAQQAKAAQAAQAAKAAKPAPQPQAAGSPKQIAQSMLASFGWGQDQFGCLDQLWQQESSWSVTAMNPSGAYGIPQALPGDKMASAGADWQSDAATQIKWGLGYIQSRYGTPCGAWSMEEADGFY